MGDLERTRGIDSTGEHKVEVERTERLRISKGGFTFADAHARYGHGVGRSKHRQHIGEDLLGEGRAFQGLVHRRVTTVDDQGLNGPWPVRVGGAEERRDDPGYIGELVFGAPKLRFLLLLDLALLCGAELTDVFVFDAGRVALDERDECVLGSCLGVLDPFAQGLEVEVLILEHMDELVHDCDLLGDVERRRAAHDDLLDLGVIQRQDRRLQRGIDRVQEIDRPAEQPEGAQGGLGFRQVAALVLVELFRLNCDEVAELILVEEPHRDGVGEREIPQHLDLGYQIRDGGIPRGRVVVVALVAERGPHGEGADTQECPDHEHTGDDRGDDQATPAAMARTRRPGRRRPDVRGPGHAPSRTGLVGPGWSWDRSHHADPEATGRPHGAIATRLVLCPGSHEIRE